MAKWGEFLNNAAQTVVGNRVAQITQPATSVPVSTGQGGVPYVEGQPAATATAAGAIFGLPRAVVIGGGAVFSLVLLLMLVRK